MVRIQRAYEEPTSEDGFRVLVDRLWPRGVKKDRLRLDLWAKDLAPSPELRIWFGHDPARFPEFARRYQAELRGEPARSLLAALEQRAADGPVTLVYGARDEQHNGAVVLRDAIQHGETRWTITPSTPRRPRSSRSTGESSRRRSRRRSGTSAGRPSPTAHSPAR